jgi:hypothetical protein
MVGGEIKENDGGGEFNYDIFVNVTMYLQYSKTLGLILSTVNKINVCIFCSAEDGLHSLVHVRQKAL